jgi:hypothetical protein
MPFDRNDPRDDMLDDRSRSSAQREPDDEDLSGSLATLFEMFGGQVMDPAPRD